MTPHTYLINGTPHKSEHEWVGEETIIRLGGGEPETHEIHQPGWENGHPLTNAVNVINYPSLRVITSDEAYQARLQSLRGER